MNKKIKNVLISVSDKSELPRLALFLQDQQATIYATSGTALGLRQLGIKVKDAEEIARSPEILGGRVKTLSSTLMACILADTHNPEHLNELAKQELPALDLVVVNLYPFEQKTNDLSFDQGLEEWIDIGGVTLLRASAKNYKSVAILSAPSQYKVFIENYQSQNGLTLNMRKDLARQAFALTESYDLAILHKMSLDNLKENSSPFHRQLNYGENAHQKAWVQASVQDIPWQVLRGESFSANTYADCMGALEGLFDLSSLSATFFGSIPSCVIIKHQAPCGMAIGRSNLEALERARNCDDISSFGGILAIDRKFEAEDALWAKKYFWEVIIATDFSSDAMEILAQKKGKLRLLKANLNHPAINGIKGKVLGPHFNLIQEYDQFQKETWDLKTGIWENEDQALFHFGLCVVKNLKSNAVCIVSYDNEGLPTLMGAGQGQPNRLQAFSKLALPQAQARPQFIPQKAMMISEAFMPFSDLVEEAAKAQILKIVAPAGSVKDEEVALKAQELGVSLAFTHRRHFKH